MSHIKRESSLLAEITTTDTEAKSKMKDKKSRISKLRDEKLMQKKAWNAVAKWRTNPWILQFPHPVWMVINLGRMTSQSCVSWPMHVLALYPQSTCPHYGQSVHWPDLSRNETERVTKGWRD